MTHFTQFSNTALSVPPDSISCCMVFFP